MDRRSFVALAGAAMVAPRGAAAQSYPVKPIRMIVAFAAGGPADLFARALASGMSTRIGQQVVVDNRTGAAGLTGIEAVAKAEPDGYQIGLAGAAALATVPFMIAKMPFDWEKNLSALTLVSRVPEVIVTKGQLGIKTVADLVAHAKKNAGKLNFGSAGLGSITHLASELFKVETGTDITHVPYRGAAPAVNDLIAGHIDMVTADVPVLLPHIRSGSVNAVAVTTEHRIKALPDTPTTAEAGYPKVVSDNWYGLVAPAGLASDVAEKLHAAAVATLRSDEIGKQFASQDAIPSPTSPAEFVAFIKDERAKWGPLITSLGLKLE